MARKYLVTEDEFLSANVDDDGFLTFTRDNGDVVVAGPVQGEQVTDSQMAAQVADAESQTSAAMSAKIVEARGFVVDTEYPSLSEAFGAVAEGGILEIRSAHVLTATFTVNKACTVRFTDGQFSTTDPNVDLLAVTADNVTVEKPRLRGAGVAVSGTGRGIRAYGTVTTRIKNLKVLSPDVSGINYIAVEVKFGEDITVEGGEIQQIGYSGVTFLSVDRGRVSAVNIHDVIQPSGYVNSYGVAFTHWADSDPRSTDCIARGNAVTNVPWEGIDTHGGSGITVEGNIVTNCGAGVAIVTGGEIAAKNARVVNNTIVDAGRSGGIVFAGKSTASTSPSTDPATGVIMGNTLKRTGKDGTGNAAIIAYDTKGLTITGNEISESAVSGIILNFNNVDTTIVGNTFTDVWSATILAQAIFVGQYNNSGVIVGNAFMAGTKTAAHLNEYGVRFSGSAAPAKFQVSANKWTAATTAVSDSGGAIIRPEITGSRAGNAALASLLTQLSVNYLIKDSTTA